MRVKQSKSKNTINYAIIKDIKVGNKRTSTIVENLGNHNTLLKEYPPKSNCGDGTLYGQTRNSPSFLYPSWKYK